MRLSRFIPILLALTLPLGACEINDFTGVVDPDAPTDLSYQLIPSGDPELPLGVILTWTPPQSGRATTFDVYGRSSSSEGWIRRATTTSYTFHDAGLPQLQYYVSAFDGAGNELGRTDVIVIDERNRLPAPLNLTSISLDRAVQLSWSSNAVEAGPSIFDFYRVYSTLYDNTRSRCSDQWSLEGTTVSDAFLASNLSNGVTRCFAVSAVSRDGHESTWSAVRQDTPRYDAHNVLVYARDARAASAGFLFYDEVSHDYGVVGSATRSDLDFTVERHTDGSLWFAPGRTDVKMALYGTTQVGDLTSIDRAPSSGFGSVTIEALPGYAYVFSTRKSDGMHFAATRVAYVGADYVVFDWSFQSGVGSPELSRVPSGN
jgi:hypothetical protein